MEFDRLVLQGAKNCRLCGECLSMCGYLDLDLKDAKKEMKKLRDGKTTPVIERKCVSCYACEAACPNDGHQYLAIQDRRQKKYKKTGLPLSVLYMLYNGRTNFRSRAVRYMKTDDKNRLLEWAANEKEDSFDEVFYPGCNLLTTPSLGNSGILKNIKVAGSFERCCGEMFFRLGMIDEAREKAEVLGEFYKKKKIGRMVFVCPACYNMFANVIPKLFGVEFDFEKIYFSQWLLEKIENHDFEVKNPLDVEFQIHDSCHARVMGEAFTENIRTLVEVLGGRVEDGTKNARIDGLCCGIAAGAKSHSVIDIIRVANRARGSFKKAPTAQPMAYCTGCSLTLTLTGMFLPGAVSIVHLLHIANQACGFKKPASMRSLAWPAVFSIIEGTRLLLSNKRDFINPERSL